MNTNHRVAEILQELNIPPHMKGYAYTCEAITRCLNDREAMHNVSAGLYVRIANKYNTTPRNVERGIRYAISKSTESQAFPIKYRKYFPWLNGKPTNKEFIAALAAHLKLEAGAKGA